MNIKDLPRIGIIGSGSMGREVERLAALRSFQVTEIFDINRQIRPGASYSFDIAIDFSHADAVINNAEAVAAMGRGLVIGTTGWLESLGEVRAIAEKYGTGMVYGSNFSIGMQMFYRIVEQASRLVSNVEGYDIMLHEIHHSAKKDSPSGTALTLADIIISESGFKNHTLIQAPEGRIQPDRLHVSSTRGGSVPGTHTVYMDSEADTIELTHRARNRSGFASGALTAAAWLFGKSGFFDFTEVMNTIWSEKK